MLIFILYIFFHMLADLFIYNSVIGVLATLKKYIPSSYILIIIL